jgi:hypothetical protein
MSLLRRRTGQPPSISPAVPAQPAAEPAVGLAGMIAAGHSLGRCHPDCNGRLPLANCPELAANAAVLLAEEVKGLTPTPIADAVRAQLARRRP